MEYHIESDRLVYRQISEEDSDTILKWRNSEDVRRNSFSRNIVTKENHLSWFEKYIRTGKRIQFIFSDKESGADIGSVYLSDFEDNTAEYGIFIGDTSNYNKGYGTEVARAMVDFAFHTLKIETLHLSVFEKNSGAIGSYEKAGFKKVREEKQLCNDTYENVIFMSVHKQAE